MKAPIPARQDQRLAALRALEILDTPREAEFDEIVELASRICETPISVINLIDEHRQWFKSETGLGVRETPLDTSICAHVILETGLTVIPDTLQDHRMADNPLCLGEPHLRFYAGALLRTDDGHAIGTLCVLDKEPRDLSDLQRFALEVLSRQVMTQILLRRSAADERAARQLADTTIRDLEKAARTQETLVSEIDHRVKNSLSTVAAMLNLQVRASRSPEIRLELGTARDRVLAVAAIHDQLHVSAKFDRVDMPSFMDRLVASMVNILPPNATISHDIQPMMLETRVASAVGVIVNELATNAYKHAFTDGRKGRIALRMSRTDDLVTLQVSDDGVGLKPDPGGDARVGLGLRVVRSSVEQLGGSLEQMDLARGYGLSITFPIDARDDPDRRAGA